LAVGKNNNIYIARNNTPVQVAASPLYSTYSTFNSTVADDYGVAVDPSGNVWISNATGNSSTANIQEFSTSNGSTPIRAIGPAC